MRVCWFDNNSNPSSDPNVLTKISNLKLHLMKSLVNVRESKPYYGTATSTLQYAR